MWMIYGANGYTGELVAREAVRRGMSPVLAGRNADKVRQLAEELNLQARSFLLDNPPELHAGLKDIHLVLHCAGPFSATAAPMIDGCLNTGTHYLDIAGEIDVFEYAHAPAQARRANSSGVVLCPGVGFDVVPTDCVALKLKQAMPEATHLSLGFETRSRLSTGTVKTIVEGMADGCMVRRDGKLCSQPMGQQARRIDFGTGKRTAMTIPWGDVSTAFHTTGIPNIDVWVPIPRPLIWGARLLNPLRTLVARATVQRMLKRLAESVVRGPDEATRQRLKTQVWGEARDTRGATQRVRIEVANLYSLTVEAALTTVCRLTDTHQPHPEGGSYTPAVLFGPQLVEQLPGSHAFRSG